MRRWRIHGQLLDRLHGLAIYWRHPYCIYVLYVFFHQHTSILINKRGEQDEVAGVVSACVSAECLCHCQSVQPAVFACTYVCSFELEIYAQAYFSFNVGIKTSSSLTSINLPAPTTPTTLFCGSSQTLFGRQI